MKSNPAISYLVFGDLRIAEQAMPTRQPFVNHVRRMMPFVAYTG